MDSWSTRLPDAIDQLVLIAQQAEELAEVDVRDGPALGDRSKPLVLYIGWTGGEADTDAEAQVAADGLLGNPDVEQSIVRCTASALLGSGTMSEARRAAYAMVSGLGAAIARNRSLNGTVMRAQIGSHALTQQQTSKGTAIAVTFEVELNNFTGR
jgi:hypothetical protein